VKYNIKKRQIRIKQKKKKVQKDIYENKKEEK